jgi:hypothetical protein
MLPPTGGFCTLDEMRVRRGGQLQSRQGRRFASRSSAARTLFKSFAPNFGYLYLSRGLKREWIPLTSTQRLSIA